MHASKQALIEEKRRCIGSALLEVQDLGRRHKVAMTKLVQAYMELGELVDSLLHTGFDCGKDVA